MLDISLHDYYSAMHLGAQPQAAQEDDVNRE